MKGSFSSPWRLLLSSLVLAGTLSRPARAQETPFVRVRLPYGISLEVPSHWKVLPAHGRDHRDAAAQEAVGALELRGGRGTAEPLLVARPTPAPAGAAVRLNVSSPAEFTEGRLAAAGPEDLKALRAELLETFRRLETRGGPKVLDLQPPKVVRVNGRLALVVGYLRAGARGTSPWGVTQYKIPLGGRLLELTLSHRQSEASAWLPALEHVRDSLRF